MAVGPSYLADIDASRRKLDVASVIKQVRPNESTFTVALLNAKKKPCFSDTINWYDTTFPTPWTKINNGGGYADNATQFVVDSADSIRPKDVIVIARTGEHIFVGAVNHTNHTLSSCIRAYGTTAAAAINDDDDVLVLANAKEENSTASESRVYQPTRGYNYVQEVETTFDSSLMASLVGVNTAGDERDRLTQEALILHRRSLERVILLGERYQDTTNKRNTCGGIKSFITTNAYNVGGTLTESKLEAICKLAFEAGNPEKWMICPAAALGAVSQMSSAKLTTSPDDSVYGAKVTTYRSAHGDLKLVRSRTLSGYYDGTALIVDMPEITFRPLQTQDTFLEKDIQANDKRGWMDRYITAFSLEVRSEPAHVHVYGITA